MHPFDSMECPGCGATLPATATGCACGYRFVLPNAPSTPRPGVTATEGAQFAPPPMEAMRSTSSSEGTFIGGLALGFFCGCIGLAIAYAVKTGPQTKQGALVGFGVGLVVGAFLRFMEIGAR